MKDMTVLLMPLEDGYRAVIGALFLDTDSLVGFGTHVENLLRRRFGNEEIDVEWALSRDLKPSLPACPRCNGTEKVEVEGIHGAQYLADEFSKIDWTKRAEGTCPMCKGLGANVEHFWE